MKYLLLTVLAFNYSLLAFSQNLVPNPSFEEYTACPDNTNLSHYAIGWSININTADYFNTCVGVDYTDISVPHNSFGYQIPNSGNAYIGFFAGVFIPNSGRETFGCELINPLIIGNKYFIKFYISLANTSNCAINKIGALFLTQSLYEDTIIIPFPYSINFSNIYSQDIITDTAKWVAVSGSFIADSSYKYLLIGDFFDSQNTDSIFYNTSAPFCQAYYYVDDVCVSTDSNYCNLFTSNKILNSNDNLNILVNPIEKALEIECNSVNFSYDKCTVEIFNSLGNKQKIGVEIENANKLKIKLLNQTKQSNFYLIKINFNNKTIVKKVVF